MPQERRAPPMTPTPRSQAKMLRNDPPPAPSMIVVVGVKHSPFLKLPSQIYPPTSP